MDLLAFMLGPKCRGCGQRMPRGSSRRLCSSCRATQDERERREEEAARARRDEHLKTRLAELAPQMTQADEDALLAHMRRLCQRWAANEHDDDMVALAQAVGHELNRRGGMKAMRAAFDRLGRIPGARTLEMWWGGVGHWQG